MRGTQTALVCLVAVLVVALAAGTVGAQEETAEKDAQPETAEEFVTALNDLRGAEAFEEYPELELARSQAVVEIQTGDGFTDDDQRRMRNLLNALETFQTAHANASSNPVESVETANETYASLTELEENGGTSYATLGFVAIERFYGAQGERIYEEAQVVSSTSAELRLLDAAVLAYERSGDTQRYSEIHLEREETRTEYETDVERHDERSADAAAYLETCEEACESPVALVTDDPLSAFSAYAGALQAHDAASESASIANEHGLGEESDAAEYRNELSDALVNAAIASVALVAAYVLGMVGLATAVVWRLSAWADDTRAAANDRIVTPQEVEHA